jgi:hypothetical protein
MRLKNFASDPQTAFAMELGHLSIAAAASERLLKPGCSDARAGVCLF